MFAEDARRILPVSSPGQDCTVTVAKTGQFTAEKNQLFWRLRGSGRTENYEQGFVSRQRGCLVISH